MKKEHFVGESWHTRTTEVKDLIPLLLIHSYETKSSKMGVRVTGIYDKYLRIELNPIAEFRA